MNYQELEQEQLIGYWAKKKYGVKAKDIFTHPEFNDLRILLEIRNNLWNDITRSNQASWACFWEWCFHRKKKLKQKHLDKLENITINGLNTQKYKQQRKLSQAQKIKALRNPTVITQNKKTDYNMTAKESVADASPPWGA
jgi:hypothetical protein